MKFSEKLPKQRKNNNLSQELLAEKLGVSRQAVSKWESGISYPDMEKIIEICKILNCNLEDLLDDGVISRDKKKKENTEDLFYLDMFLEYITKIYNMFIAMSTKEKVKCILELFGIALILLMANLIIKEIFFQVFLSITNTFSFFDYIYYIFEILLEILLTILSFITFFHLFKIRYLNYYITVKDNNVKEKIIEKEIEPIIKKEPREKIIIRDPKDSSYSFLNILGKIFNSLFIFFSILFFIPAVFSFVGIIAGTIFVISYLSYNMIALYISIILIGILLFNYLIINILYSIIFKKKINTKIIFTLLITSLIITGTGSGLTAISFSNFDFYKTDYSKYEDYFIEKEYELHEIESYIYNYVDDEYTNDNIKIIFDNKRKNALIEVSSKMKINLDKNYFGVWVLYNNIEYNEIYDVFLNDLKDNKIRTNYYEIHDYTVTTITISEENYNKIKNSYTIID